ncbi:MAG: L,D-transpeptidase family protein [Pseudobdellovibrionaceae bacterium]
MKLRNRIKKLFILGMSATLFVPGVSYAYGEASVIQGYVNRQTTVPLIKPLWGNFIFHTDSLNKLYSTRGYQAIWVDNSGLPNSMAQALKSVLLSVDRHGLSNGDYWDADVENLFQAAQKNQKNWITFELAASEALIRYVSHLSVGRFDPEKIDTDIKFKQKIFNEYADLSNAISNGVQSLSSALDIFAPVHPRYKDLMDILVTLKALQSQGGWTTIKSPGFVLKLGVSHPVISQLRDRLNKLGYPVSNEGGNTFDAELDAVIKQYQAMNGLTADGVIGTRSEVLRSLNYSVNQRILQVALTMEKLRWLPKNMETRHIFVNLATTEFHLFDDSGEAKRFKTVNGDPFHRTPSMIDKITYVNLNPYWTVPRSIAINETIKNLRTDPNYLSKHNMVVVDEATDKVMDPATIDWQNMNEKKLTYYFRQLPGTDNSLGVVKFPLQNPWSIYMHDTDHKEFFNNSERHLSHGCVRLEEPLGLAAYLLQDQPGYSFDELRAIVPQYEGIPAGDLDKKIRLTKAMPVYFMYLTVEKGDNGTMRFVDDVYGQDIRLAKALQNKKSADELF